MQGETLTSVNARACFTLDWRQQTGNGVVSRKIRNPSDIAAIEREGFSAFLPETSPLELIEGTSKRFPDNAAIRSLTNVGAPDTDGRESLSQTSAKAGAWCD